MEYTPEQLRDLIRVKETDSICPPNAIVKTSCPTCPWRSLTDSSVCDPPNIFSKPFENWSTWADGELRKILFGEEK